MLMRVRAGFDGQNNDFKYIIKRKFAIVCEY